MRPLMVSVLLALVLLVGGAQQSKWLDAIALIYHEVRVDGERWLDWVGTGAFIDSNVVLTAAHLHPDGYYDNPFPYSPDEVRILQVKPYKDEKTYLTKTLIKAPNEADIMLLRVYGYKSKLWLKIGKAKAGERVTILAGRAISTDNPVIVETVGTVTATNFPQVWGVNEPTLRFMITFLPPMWGGASGSPLISKKGNVVGVVVGFTRNGQAVAEVPEIKQSTH